jgi:hypothetical protein
MAKIHMISSIYMCDRQTSSALIAGFVVLLCVLLVGFPQLVMAQEISDSALPQLITPPADSLFYSPEPVDSLFYAADSVSYYQEKEQIRLFGNTSVQYHEFSIGSDSLLVDMQNKKAYSFGNTVMQDGEQILLGSDVSYDIDTQTGVMTEGASKFDKGFYTGESIRKIADDIYDVDNGSFTTCDLEEPDFWFTAKELRIYRGDKIVGKPVIAYVNHLPVFYFPFVTIPIRRGRHTGFLIPVPGYNSVDGKFLRDISWYYPYKDYADLTLSMDVMERTGWKAEVSLTYLDRYRLSGGFNGIFQRKVSGDQTYYDWSLRANHHQELANKSTFDLNLDFVSNKRVWESSDILDESLAQQVTSSISYRKPLLSSYLNIGANYTEDLINDRVSVTLPSASISFPTRPVYELFYKPQRTPDTWWSNLGYSYSVRYDHIGAIKDSLRSLQDIIWNNEPDPADTTSMLVQHNMGIKHHLGLSYNWKLRGWLGLQHGITYNEAWFDRDKEDGSQLVRGNDYSFYTNSSFNIYGIHNYKSSWLKSVRHIITPSLGFSYNPDLTGNQRFYSFGGIGLASGARSANLSLSVEQKWQIKYGKDNKKVNDLIGLSSRISGNLLKDKPFGSLTHSAYFHPGNFALGEFRLPGSKLRLSNLMLGYSAQYTLTHDPYKFQILNWHSASQYLTHAFTLTGNAPYKIYFEHPKNRVFDAYSPQDSLQIQSEQIAAKDNRGSWKLSLSHDLAGTSTLLHPTSQNLRADVSLKVSANWALSYSTYFDLKGKDQLSQSINLTRDLHCWKLEFSYTKRNEFWEYRIALFNTMLPDALRFQTHDSKKY